MEVVGKAGESASESWPVDVGRIVVVKFVLPVVEGVVLSDVFIDFVDFYTVLLFVT